jgi:hypothetical protein
VDYGEDQAWAAEVLGHRYSLIYAPTARVIHSHDYDPHSRFERSKTESYWWRKIFGYDLAPEDPGVLVSRMNAGDEQWGSRNMVAAEVIKAKQALNVAEIAGLVEGSRRATVDLAEAEVK